MAAQNRLLTRLFGVLAAILGPAHRRTRAGAGIETGPPSATPGGGSSAIEPAPRQAGITLEAAAGETAQGIFLVENLLPTPVKGQIVATVLRSSAAGEVQLPFAIEPPVAVLNPRDQLLARLSLVVPEHLAPGEAYIGEIKIPELKGTTIPLVVRRLPETRPADLPMPATSV